MNYFDAFGLPLNVGDEVIYRASGYQRSGKITAITQSDPMNFRIDILTVSAQKTLKRTIHTQRSTCNIWCLARYMTHPNHRDLIDQRLQET